MHHFASTEKSQFNLNKNNLKTPHSLVLLFYSKDLLEKVFTTQIKSSGCTRI